MNELSNDSHSNAIEQQKVVANIIHDIEVKRPGLLDNIQNKEELISGVVTAIASIEIHHKEESHSGPLPSPRTLKKYDEIIPNGAERIVSVFEKQADHRMTLEKMVIGRQTFQSLLGQIFGFIIAIVFLIAGIYLVIGGHETAGISVFALDIVGLAAVFVIGKRSQKRKLEENE